MSAPEPSPALEHYRQIAQGAAPRKDLRGCAPCKAKLLAAMKAQAAPMNPRILIAIGFCAADGTSTAATPLGDKLAILERCLASADQGGADDVVIIATGNADAVQKALPDHKVLGIGHALDRQQGESSIGLAALRYAERKSRASRDKGFDWIVKVAGDTHHARAGWARTLVGLGMAHGAEVVATAHHRPGWINTQVYAIRPGFMRRTWPMPQDPALKRIGIEAVWGARVDALHLRARWHKPEAVKIAADGCENFSPAATAIAYRHAHTLATAARWPEPIRTPSSTKPPKLSIIIPARNEIYPAYDGRPLHTSTFESIADTSRDFGMPECILVDDCSDKALPPVNIPDLPLKIIRNASVMGVDPSRNIGAAAATGDVIAILDDHIRVQTSHREPIPGGLQKLAALAAEKQAIVVARCGHLEALGVDAGTGASFVRLQSPGSHLAIGWNRPGIGGVYPVEALLGADYFFPRDIWERLGGFIESCRVWGFSEEGISLKAHFLGIPILGCDDITISHHFRSGGPHPFYVDEFQKWCNRARVLKVTFEEETFQRVWMPRLQTYQWGPQWDAAMAEPSLLAEAAAFRARKIRDDSEILREFFGLELAAQEAA